MNLDKQTILMKVRKIVKQQSMGPLLYHFWFSVACSRSGKVAQANLVGPSVCVTSKHSLPTTNGWKPAEEVKVGDVVLFSLDLVTRDKGN